MRRLAMLLPVLALSGCVTTETVLNLSPAATMHDTDTTGFLFNSLTVNGEDRRYAVYVPRDYTPDKEWPVIVFLNGRGECGTDGQKQIAVGLATAVMLDAKSWPFIVVFPQKPDYNSDWSSHEGLVLGALDKTLEEYSTDKSRVYLTGLSQGGRGTWEIGAKHADRFAAIAPICGWGDPATLALALAKMPCWAFHGEKDRAVPVSGTKNLVAALEKINAPVKMTIYPEADHNSWDQAYRTEKMGEWFLTHKK